MALQTDQRRRMAFLESLQQREANGGERPAEAWKLTPIQKIKVGAFIKSVRRRCGMTQEQFAVSYGVVKRTMIRWEKGTFTPPKEILDRMRELGKTKNLELAL